VVTQLRADVVVSTMAVIAKKIEMMDTRLTEGQERLVEGQMRLENRMDHVVERQTRLENRMDNLAERQTRLESRMDQVVEEQVKTREDIAEIKITMDSKFAIIEENNQVINRKLNALLAHIGAAE
jgi:predicted  nucleic acid-binding Zn-ribbon protein